MFEMKLATCEAVIGVLPESTYSQNILLITGEHFPFGDRRFRGVWGSLRLLRFLNSRATVEIFWEIRKPFNGNVEVNDENLQYSCTVLRI